MARPSSRSPPEIRHVLNQTKLEIYWVVAFQIPSLKLTWHLKMDGWNTIASFLDGLFSGAMLVSRGGFFSFYPGSLGK